MGLPATAKQCICTKHGFVLFAADNCRSAGAGWHNRTLTPSPRAAMGHGVTGLFVQAVPELLGAVQAGAGPAPQAAGTHRGARCPHSSPPATPELMCSRYQCAHRKHTGHAAKTKGFFPPRHHAQSHMQSLPSLPPQPSLRITT